MPFYLYEHLDRACDLGQEFEHMQSMSDERLAECPTCGGPVRRILPRGVTFATRQSASELRDKGFTKLVRRDKGVYENVTARSGEDRIVDTTRGGQTGSD
jgi:putative FmdB family regulatory protein